MAHKPSHDPTNGLAAIGPALVGTFLMAGFSVVTSVAVGAGIGITIIYTARGIERIRRKKETIH